MATRKTGTITGNLTITANWLIGQCQFTMNCYQPRLFNSKTKSETNGNYSSSNSSTTSSTHSTEKSNSNKMASQVPPQPSDGSVKHTNPPEKMPVKKLANKSTQVDALVANPKTFSLSDSETSNSKLRQLPPSDSFRFPKYKASSSPIISNSTSHPSGNNSPKRISHAFLAGIDKETFKRVGMATEPLSRAYAKAEETYESNIMDFPLNRRANIAISPPFISTGGMLTEDMLLNGSLSRIRYLNPQNMHVYNEANAWTANHMVGAEAFMNSPSRTKNFMPSVSHQKRR